MSSHFNQIANRRQQGKCDFTYNDILMSAFACMYFQDLSLLQFQKLIEEKQGRKNLSYNMYLLTLLAFFCHQILELTDLAYQACREKFGSKRYLWEVFRGNMWEHLFDSWTDFMDFILNPEDWEVSRVKKA
jgi:hypothetical protein